MVEQCVDLSVLLSGPQVGHARNDHGAQRCGQCQQHTLQLLGLLVIAVLQIRAQNAAQHGFIQHRIHINGHLRQKQCQCRAQMAHGRQLFAGFAKLCGQKRPQAQIAQKQRTAIQQNIDGQIGGGFHKHKNARGTHQLHCAVAHGDAAKIFDSLKKPGNIRRRCRQLNGGKAPHQRMRRARHRCKKIHRQCCAHACHTQAENLPENAGAGSGIVTRNGDHTLAMHSRAQGRRQRKAGNDGLRIGICADALGPQHTRNIRCDYKGHQHNEQLIPQIE